MLHVETEKMEQHCRLLGEPYKEKARKRASQKLMVEFGVAAPKGMNSIQSPCRLVCLSIFDRWIHHEDQILCRNHNTVPSMKEHKGGDIS